ncbi:MAG: hypothetical protein K2Y32_16760 [Candidatus Obscuribacterales bacterium]|nr:hypothetical protein [Candidatus Obscuribacterales bacterium]
MNGIDFHTGLFLKAARYAALLWTLLFFCTFSKACAWTLTPMKVEKELKPGETITDVLVVDNSGSSDTKRYEVKIVDWTLDERGELKYFEPGILPGSISTGVVCSPMQFKLSPGERKLIRYTLPVPADAKPGEHTLGVQVLEVVIPPKDPDTGRINVGVAVKCGFLGAMTIVCPKAEPTTLDATALNIMNTETTKQPSVVLQIENKANVRSRPRWSFRILDDSNKEVASKDWQDYLILRESKREIALQLDSPLTKGTYKLIGKLDQGLPYAVQELEKQFEVR